MIDLSTNNILIRFVIALVVFIILKALIDETVSDAGMAKILRIILIVICLLIIFALQIVLH